MGLRAGLTEISPESLAQILAGSQPPLSNGMRHSIDKAWNDFHVVFQSKGLPLSLAISGDLRHPQCEHSLEEFRSGTHDYFVGYASPTLVHDVNSLLINWTAADYKQLESELFGNQYNCGETIFSNLRTAYVGASERHNALEIVIC